MRDDISTYLTIAGYSFIGDDFVKKWNAHPVFLEYGIQMDAEKSKWVKKDGEWLGELNYLV